MKHKSYLLIAFLFFFVACGDCIKDLFVKDKEFSLKTIPYTENELRIDGYYHKKYNDKYSNVLVFYANGVRFGGSGVTTTNEIEDELRDPDYTKKLSNRLTCWGPYEINNNVLRFEYYDIFGNFWRTCIAHCEILNDTTFIVEKITFSKTGKEVNVEREGSSSGMLGEFHFKQFSPKPDSTNTVVK